MSEVHSDPYDDPTSPIHFELRLVERLVPSSAGGVDDNRSSHEILAPPAWRAGIRTLAIVPESTDAWNCGKSIAHQLIADLPNLHTVSFVANDQPGIVDEILEFRAVCAVAPSATGRRVCPGPRCRWLRRSGGETGIATRNLVTKSTVAAPNMYRSDGGFP